MLPMTFFFRKFNSKQLLFEAFFDRINIYPPMLSLEGKKGLNQPSKTVEKQYYLTQLSTKTYENKPLGRKLHAEQF